MPISPSETLPGSVPARSTAIVLACFAFAAPIAATDPPTRELVFLSELYSVDRIYRSMQGPQSQMEIVLGAPGAEPELLWITGFSAEMVDETGRELPADFMCHSNLDLEPTRHRETLAVSSGFGPRVFTLSQGRTEARFPPGFGIPILSSESMNLQTQVLNLNLESPDLEVRHQTRIEYVRQADLSGAMTALYPTAAYGLALLEGDSGHFGVTTPNAEHHGPGCLVRDNAASGTYEDPFGRRFTGHWVVEPGREVNRTLVTHLMALPYDTTLHYAIVHLHPFAESIELRDLTTGSLVLRSEAENHEDRIGLRHVDEITSAEGIPLFADHEYEVVSVYDNPTDEPQDSMAVLYLYLRDRDFELEGVLPPPPDTPSAVRRPQNRQDADEAL